FVTKCKKSRLTAPTRTPAWLSWGRDFTHRSHGVASMPMEGSILDNAPAPVAERLFCEAVLDSTPDLACLVDRSHRCVYANRAMLEAVGRPAGEVLGRSLAELDCAALLVTLHGSAV